MSMKIHFNRVLLLLGLSVLGTAIMAKPPASNLPSPASSHGPQTRGAEYVSPAAVPVQFHLDARLRPAIRPWRPGDALKEIPRRRLSVPRLAKPLSATPRQLDALAQSQRASNGLHAPSTLSAPNINVAGIGDQGVTPPDPSGDVGTSHFVQAVNGVGGSLYSIFRKSDGVLVAGPFNMDGLGSPPCNSGFGDPIVLFDELANRWLLTEFQTANFNLCVYLSQGADPTVGTWTQYAFLMPAFPDYPKYGVWPDGFYVGANFSFGAGIPVCVFDRVRMLAGQPATMQCKSVPKLGGFGFELMLPVDWDGASAPPNGAGGLFVRHRDDEIHNSANNDPTGDFLDLVQLNVDWNTPANTRLSAIHSIPVSDFSSDFEVNRNFGNNFGALAQPDGNATATDNRPLDPLLEVPMYRVGYRNFGTHESMVLNHVTDVLPQPSVRDVAGVRWYELRRANSASASAWFKFMEGTYAPDDVDRFMAASAQDASGNLALAYSVVHDQNPDESSGDVAAGLRYTGRRVSDPANIMGAGEITLRAGNGVQNSDRWGDYSQMGIDPVDGCTFWFTGEYLLNQSVSADERGTRVAAMRFSDCGQPSFTLHGQPIEQSICAISGANLAPIGLSVGRIGGFNTAVNVGFASPLPIGFSASFSGNPITPIGSGTALLLVAATAAPGAHQLTLQGSAAGMTKDIPLNIMVNTALAPPPMPVAPIHHALNVKINPVLNWNAGAQSNTFTVQVATDAAFTNVVVNRTLNSSSLTVSPDLNPNTLYYWRVRANNVCGSSAFSPVRQFRTAPPPDQCPTNSLASTVFGPENFDAVAMGEVPAGWQLSGVTSGNPSLARWQAAAEHAASAPQSVRHRSLTNVVDARLHLPNVGIPGDVLAAQLQFRQTRNLEIAGGGAECYDAGLIELSDNNGASFAPVMESMILTEPYTQPVSPNFGNPLGNQPAWCGFKSNALTVVDLTDFIGNPVMARFRAASDQEVVASTQSGVVAGWYVDDVKIQTCRNRAPQTVGTLPNASEYELVNLNLPTAVAFSDIDTAQLIFSLTIVPPLPASIQINALTGVISGAAPTGSAGSYAVTVNASDGSSTVAQGFNLTVLANGIFSNGFE